MAAVPGHLETDRQPPMTVPLRHFVVGLGFLVAGVAVGVAAVAGAAPGLAGPAHLHLLLVGWVCVTIMDAMTQFVPVWSGTTLHSRRLASAQLALVTVGLAGFATALLAAAPAWLAPAGALVVLGFDEDGAEHAGADVLVHVRDRTVVDEHAGVHRFEPDGGGLAGGDSSVLGTAARPVDGVDVDVVRHRAVGLAGEAQRHRVAAADPELAVRDAIGAIEHTVPGNHVNLATHGDLGLPGEFLYDALSTEYPDLEYEYVEQCGCGGHVTRVYVE
jgi:putative CGCGG family rSAM target protein